MLFVYARVSTIEQDGKGAVSIPEQIRKGRAIAAMRGIPNKDVVQFVDRGVSGSTPLAHRPQGSEMLASLQKGDVVVCAKLDRMFRSATDALLTAEALKQRGVELVSLDLGTESITANGVAKLIFGILAMMAEFERDRIRERTEEGRRGKLARNGYMGGGPPIGLKVVGKGREAQLEKDESQQPLMERIKELKSWGYTPNRMARHLTKHFPQRSGKPWQCVQMQRILARMVNANG
jgi:DNA invertase Pin-like site-specific DNA recombinase